MYVTQNVNGTVYLSRYYVSRDGYYHYVDHMTINNAGHGQTLEEFTYGGKTYFLMTLTENPIDGIYWSTDIGCVEYKGGTTINSNNQKRFVGIKVNGKTDVKRVDAALSSDKSQIAIWKKNADNEIEICTYSFDEFKKILLNDTTGTTASISKLTEKHSINDSDLDFPKSFQGIELSNEVDGVSSIYIAGGNESEDDMPLVIARYNTNGNLKRAYRISYSLAYSIQEMEGIHINGDYLNFGLVPAPIVKKGVVDKPVQRIYEIDKNLFK